MFTRPTVTSTAVIAGKLRLRFRGLLQKAHAIQDVSTQAVSSPPTYEVPAIPRLVQSTLVSNDKAAATSVFPSTPRRPQPSSNSSSNSEESAAFGTVSNNDEKLNGDELGNVGESMDPLEAEYWFACEGTGRRDVRPFEVFVDGGFDVEECGELGYQDMEGLVCGTLRCGLLWPSKD